MNKEMNFEGFDPSTLSAVSDAAAWLHGSLIKVQEEMPPGSTAVRLFQGQILGRNNHSRLHQLAGALREGRVVDFTRQKFESPLCVSALAHAQSFLIEHDWVAAFNGAVGYDEWGPVRQPYPICAFEFIINGRPVICVSSQNAALTFLSYNHVWMKLWVDEHDNRELNNIVKHLPLTNFAWLLVRAVLIALEAEIAKSSVVRAPQRLNKKRRDRGNLPLYDYHVVSLNRAARPESSELSGTHSSPRLHFRRGHWRQLGEEKTWVKWTLVGNPDIGFIDKHYRL